MSTETSEVPRSVGRPDSYSQEIADRICEGLADGRSLRSVCDDEDMPSKSTVFKWLRTLPEFLHQYELAKAESADSHVDDMTDIADDGRNDWMEKHDKEGSCVGYQVNGEHVQRTRLRLDTRKWIASKLKPKKYGERTAVEMTGADGKDLIPEQKTPDAIARRVLFLLERGAAATDPKT